MRKIKLEDGKVVRISEESYKELSKAVQEEGYIKIDKLKDKIKDMCCVEYEGEIAIGNDVRKILDYLKEI